MKNKVSFWLIPSEEDRIFFQKIIDTLSQEYDAPAFTPHVTIYSGEHTPDELVAELIEKAIQDAQSFSLKVDKLLYTDEFTKTVFVQFHSNPILSKISDTLRNNSKNLSEFSLNPHLSLIYQHLSEELKKNLATSISLPKPEVFFNEVSAISTPGKVQGRKDVERWKTIFNKKLQ